MKMVNRKVYTSSTGLHQLRLSSGAHVQTAAISLTDILDLMGQGVVKTTAICAMVEDEHLRSALRKLGSGVPVYPAGEKRATSFSDFVHAFSGSLTESVPRMPRGAAIHGTAATGLVLGDTWV